MIVYDTITIHIDPNRVNLWVRGMITGFQIRAARNGLRWSSEELARHADVAPRTIKRLEQTDGIPGGRAQTLNTVQKTLEAAGIEFVGTPEDGPGVRLRRA